jgi:prolyl-tRNA synthetase
MKFSQLAVKTNKNAKSYESKNATLLIKAGFIDQVMAGVYTFLPLGTRVLFNIERIVREEMDEIGTEIFMPAIVPKELWETTGRLHTVDVLMKTVGANDASLKKNDAEYVLNSTHEEVVTPLGKKFNRSYKDLPFAFYQIQTKFRNEPRAKSGILRCREFRMKDMYSFHVSEEDLKLYYEKAKIVYAKVFERLGLGKDTLIVLASGGDFTPDYSHEFQTRLDTGEDTVFYSKKLNIAYNKEIAPSKTPETTTDETVLPKKDVQGVGLIGVEKLAKFLDIPVEKTTKTMLYKTDNGRLIAAAVRGDYKINEYKLLKIVKANSIELADHETVRKITGAEIGYAGILNLPESVELIMDDSTRGRINFETGANRTDYHTINVNFDRDIKTPSKFYDIKIAKPGDLEPQTQEPYEVFAASEVGNIFPLNTKFSKAFDYTVTDEKGKLKPVYMGCYGIGTSRLMGVIAEKFADDKGLVWPEAVAPYMLHLISLGETTKRAAEIYDAVIQSGISILWDDRDETAGTKFTDYDLIGIPYRLVVSPKTEESIEIKKRTEEKTSLITLEELIARFST